MRKEQIARLKELKDGLEEGEIKEFLSSYLYNYNRWGVSEHTVSHQTDITAREHGVILVRVYNGWTAIERFSGRNVRSGHKLWVLDQLKKLGAIVHQQVDSGIHNED